MWPFSGHVHPNIAIAHSLRARGHQVAFYTGASVRPVVEGEGFEFFPFTRVDEGRISRLVSSEMPYSPSLWGRLKSGPRTAAKLREWLLDTIPQQVDDIDRVLSEWGADVLLCDLTFWGPIVIPNETRPIPVCVVSITATCVLPGPHAPIWGQGWPRRQNAMMRLRSRGVSALLRWMSARFRSEVNAMRQRYGLPPLACSVTEYAGQMPLYLVPSTPEFDYERGDLPPSVHYVGPCLWDGAGSMAEPKWLVELSRDQPLIYVTQPTIGTGEPFLLRAAARAFGNSPVQVVMTTGTQCNPAELDLGVLAPNVRVEAYVPQSVLLPKTSVMVTLGGSGGVIAALRAGVPLVVVPTEWDRPENAQRVVEAGAGLRIAPGRCNPERLRTAVSRVLSEPSFRKNAQRLAASFSRYGGPDRAAQLLEGLSSKAADEKNLPKMPVQMNKDPKLVEGNP
jgi:MGT family glycosyltransferase